LKAEDLEKGIAQRLVAFGNLHGQEKIAHGYNGKK
jgi:hypothetical protein